MEDYFVIVLGVIWLAISLYKKGVKKETKGSDAIEEVAKKRSGFMDSLFEELIGVKADDHNYVDDGDDEAIIDLSEQVDSNNFVEEKIEKKEQTVVSPREPIAGNDKFRTIAYEDEYEEEESMVEKNFNLREAIIYSEIVNRPYK